MYLRLHCSFTLQTMPRWWSQNMCPMGLIKVHSERLRIFGEHGTLWLWLFVQDRSFPSLEPCHGHTDDIIKAGHTQGTSALLYIHVLWGCSAGELWPRLRGLAQVCPVLCQMCGLAAIISKSSFTNLVFHSWRLNVWQSLLTLHDSVNVYIMRWEYSGQNEEDMCFQWWGQTYSFVCVSPCCRQLTDIFHIESFSVCCFLKEWKSKRWI